MPHSTSNSPGSVSPSQIFQTQKKFMQLAHNLALYGVDREVVHGLVDTSFLGVPAKK